MKVRLLLCILLVSFVAVAGGCIKTRSYTIMEERPDQSLQGNRGYVWGTIPPGVSTEKDRKVYREKRVIEIEFYKPSELKREIKQPPQAQEAEVEVSAVQVDKSEGDYESDLQEAEVQTEQEIIAEGDTSEAQQEETVYYDTYVVKKNDTLEKIAAKVYGDWKKWKKIYEANREQIKSPDRIYIGQKLQIPRE